MLRASFLAGLLTASVSSAAAWPSKPITFIVPYPAKLLEQGAVAATSTPEELGRIVKREIGEWRAVVQRAKIEAQ